MNTKQDWLTVLILAPIIFAAVAAASIWPLALPIVLGAVALLVLAAWKPNVVSPVLVLVAIPLMRPNVLGELYSNYALYLCVAAGFIALVADKARIGIPRSYWIVIGMVGLMYLWLLINVSIFGSTNEGSIWQGFAVTGLTVVGIGFVIAEPTRRRILMRGFIWMMIALCVSFVVTFALWLVFGLGSFPLGSFTTYRDAVDKSTLYFPFTPSFGFQGVGGITFPRLTGIGREPGWMSLYCGLALLLWGRVGKRNLIGVGALVAGLLGAFSTAGFGAFVVALVVAWLARKPKTNDIAVHFFASVFKLATLGGALWLAINAPVFGFASKGDLNAISLQERSNATNAGLAALVDNPLGGVHSRVQEAINLVASIAPLGVPFALIVIGALLLPRIGHPAKRLTTAPILLLFITLLLSQPAADSTFVFVLAGLIYTTALPEATALNVRKERPAKPDLKFKTLSPAYRNMATEASRTP